MRYLKNDVGANTSSHSKGILDKGVTRYFVVLKEVPEQIEVKCTFCEKQCLYQGEFEIIFI